MYAFQTKYQPPSPWVNMIWVAREYCDLIENVSAELGDTWLNPLARLLPRMHASIVALGGPPKDILHLEVLDLEERFELFSRLRVLLGDRDSYWLEYDNADTAQGMSGSLADDLTDIYFELHHGLDAIESAAAEEREIIADWLLGYHMHWGQHLLDAERHIYDLQSRRLLAI